VPIRGNFTIRENYYKSLFFPAFLLQQYGNTADDNLYDALIVKILTL